MSAQQNECSELGIAMHSNKDLKSNAEQTEKSDVSEDSAVLSITPEPPAMAADIFDVSDASVADAKRPSIRLFRFGKRAAICIFLMHCIGFAVLGSVWYYLNTPVEVPGRDTEMIVDDGMPFRMIADRLENAGVIHYPSAFRLLARWRGSDDRIRSGRFLLNTGMTPDEVLIRLVSGPQKMDQFTISEGLPLWEIGKRLDEAGFVRLEDFSAIVRDQAFLRAHSIPFDSAEGFLLPDTYTLVRPLKLNEKSARDILGMMADAFWKQTKRFWPGGKRPDDEEFIKRIVILASIVEKETSVSGERARIAGVYDNRLKRGMLLQADPTVIYGLGETFKERLLRRHLEQKDNPYNTYQIKGLPPGPICSPGAASIRAALNPENHTYLFFVAATQGGGHVFSKTNAEHDKAVAAYRTARKRAVQLR